MFCSNLVCCHGSHAFLLEPRAFQKTMADEKTSKNASSKRSQQRALELTERRLKKGGTFLPTDVAFKGLILAALKDLYGEMESVAYPVDLLSWDPARGEGRLRVPARYVWNRMFSTFQDIAGLRRFR